jgi:hypothetical protein
MRGAPKIAGMGERIDGGFAPPRRLVTVAVQLAMVAAAERDRELVTDLAAQRPALGKAQLMSIARLTATDGTGLLCHKAHMVAIADAPWLRVGQNGLVDRF